MNKNIKYKKKIFILNIKREVQTYSLYKYSVFKYIGNL